jgi:hypothetical protein
MSWMELYLLLLLLGVFFADSNASNGRRKLLAPARRLQFRLGEVPGGTAKFLADIDKADPGKLNRIMRNSGVTNAIELIKQLNMDRDM